MRLLKKGEISRREAVKVAGLAEVAHSMPDQRLLTIRAVLPEFLLLAIAVYIIATGGSQVAIAISIAASLAFGFVWATKILIDLAFSKGA